MNNHPTKFTALVLAADRGPDDPVAKAAGVPCKSLTPIGGIPMVFRVVNALDACRNVNDIILCGPPKSIVEQMAELRDLIAAEKIRWFANKATPSSSAYHVLQTLPDEVPVLLTTADHALLSAQMVDYFCSEARATECDVVAGIARHEVVTKAHPQTRRTATRLEDGAYCGCNLFAFMTPRARLAADFWRQVETQRKNPLRVIRILGWVAVLRYLTGRLSLDEALKRVSHRLGFKAGAVIMPYAEAAVDVDSVEDWSLVERIVAERQA
ncbi:MAG: nucleotidyltransferase family protein [Desulfobacterales bacterium]|nr:MAG: nucleotidyltransferase family protein [Desulfobacterales bacterium]